MSRSREASLKKRISMKKVASKRERFKKKEGEKKKEGRRTQKDKYLPNLWIMYNGWNTGSSHTTIQGACCKRASYGAK